MLFFQIRKKYSYPSAAEHEKDFPEGLMKFITRRGFFKQGSIKESQLDPDTIQTISKLSPEKRMEVLWLLIVLQIRLVTSSSILVCFRELCALCWMLHVRDRLSISCRKYQAARQLRRDEQVLHRLCVLFLYLNTVRR